MEVQYEKRILHIGLFNITRLGNLYNAGHRHDSCLALWKKDGEAVTLMHYWELERQTGIKQQRTPSLTQRIAGG